MKTRMFITLGFIVGLALALTAAVAAQTPVPGDDETSVLVGGGRN